MRSSIVRTLLTISFAALGATTLSAQGQTVHFTTPFDFSVGRNALPAGEYHVVPIGEFALAIRQPNGRNTVFFLTNAAAAAISKPTATTVTFRRYGNRYFLSEMLNRGRGWEVPPSRMEKELAKRSVTPAPVEMVASSR